MMGYKNLRYPLTSLINFDNEIDLYFLEIFAFFTFHLIYPEILMLLRPAHESYKKYIAVKIKYSDRRDKNQFLSTVLL